jgi:hypothetical protein
MVSPTLAARQKEAYDRPSRNGEPSGEQQAPERHDQRPCQTIERVGSLVTERRSLAEQVIQDERQVPRKRMREQSRQRPGKRAAAP